MRRTRVAVASMIFFCPVVAIAVVGCGRATPPTLAAVKEAAPIPDQPLAKSELKKLVEEIGRATLAGDMDTVIDMTYPAVTDAIGGRRKALAVMEKLTKDMKANGLAFASYDAGEPGEFQTEGDNTFSIVPTRLEISGVDVRIVTNNYVLGISRNGGRSWTFIEGSGLKDKKAAAKVLPKLPATLRLPEFKEPTILDK